MTNAKIPADLQLWIEARRRHKLSHAQVQMARELGMNPRKLGKLDNHKQEPWKAPLPRYIEELYFRRFGKEAPEEVVSIEERVRRIAEKKAKRKAARAARREAGCPPGESASLIRVPRANDGIDLWPDLITQMKERGIQFDAGLTDAEVAATEAHFGFRFPPDLRAFLQTALPQGKGFPNWRSEKESVLREWLDLPCQGLLFDIEHNGFWLQEWGPQPSSLADAKRAASELVAAAPKLIPIYMHRMMPDEPHLPGNPVFSVHQTDIIHYGFNLADYLRHEFNLPGREPGPEKIRPIRFWDLDRFQDVRWADGSCVFDNSKGQLP